MPRLPPVPEDVQKENLQRIGFYKWIGMALLLAGVVLALAGIIAGGVAALEVPGYGLIVGGLVIVVMTPLVARLSDPRPYGSSRQDRE
jgi:drug/metabolite transporter (DMT)-like permease